MKPRVICWFKRDLRVQDHPALALAATLGEVLPLYIMEPQMWRQSDASGRHYAFVRECLATLRRDLAALGLPLVVRVGEACGVLEELRANHAITHLVSHEETGNAWSFRRDIAVGTWARSKGLDWREVPQRGVTRKMRGRDRWKAGRDHFVSKAQVDPPQGATAIDARGAAVPVAALMGLSDCCPGRQKGGRDRAEKALQSFLHTRGRTYVRAMSTPLEGAYACSRISPHLAFGTLSIREAVQAVDRARAGGAPHGFAGPYRSFSARLAWRDHFTQKLEDEPPLEWRAMHPDYDDLRPRPCDPVLLDAWARGRTGIPFVDACMRSLRATGWLNFRMRSMVMAVASYHLWLDWRETGAVLARYFTDYEPGIHWPQVQMQSGTTGMNTLRIYNPMKQGLDQDPEGIFTRRWVPELRDVPLKHLQNPWGYKGGPVGRSYPAPIVDVAEAARVARDRVWGLRRQTDPQERTKAIVHKHASRARPRSGGRRKAEKPGDTRQMSFDL